MLKYKVKTWKVIQLLKKSVKKENLPFIELALQVIDNVYQDNSTKLYAIKETKKLYPDLARYMEFYNENVFEFKTDAEKFKDLNIESIN